MKMNLPLVPLFIFCFINVSKSQSTECKSKINITLGQINGAPYQGIKVNLKDRQSLLNFERTTDKSGNVEFEVPCNKNFILTATNYAIEKEIVSMEQDGILTYRFNYEPEMKSKSNFSYCLYLKFTLTFCSYKKLAISETKTVYHHKT